MDRNLVTGVSLPTRDVTYAGFGRRFGAFTVDFLLVLLLAVGIGLGLSLAFPTTFVAVDSFRDEVLDTYDRPSGDVVLRITIYERTYRGAGGVDHPPCRFQKLEEVRADENGSEFSIDYGDLLLGSCEYQEKPNAAKIALLLGLLFYAPLMESGRRRATLGKMLFGLQVARIDGGPLTLSRSFLRNLAEMLCLVTLFIGYCVALFTKRHQALHDMVAGAIVVRKQPNPQAEPATQSPELVTANEMP